MKSIEFEGCNIYFDDITERGNNAGNLLSLTTAQIKNMIAPIAKLQKSIYDAIEDIAPDETEISMQLKLQIESGKPIFVIVSGGVQAEITVKFVWKEPMKKSL